MPEITVKTDEAVELMIDELREEHGDEVVEEDLSRAVRKAVASGYAQL